MMFDDDETHNEAFDRKEKGRMRARREDPGKDEEGERSEDGADGNVTRDREDDSEGCNGGERGPRRGNEKDAKSGGDAFAAAEAQPAGKDVAEHGEEGRQRLCVAQRGGGDEPTPDFAAKPDSGGALEHVEKEGGRTEAFAACAHHVRGANVAAAQGANVLPAEDADQNIPYGDGAEQISRDGNHDVRKDHDDCEFSR